MLILQTSSININVGPLLASKIKNSNVNPTQYITSSPTNSFVMSSVTETQVSTIFQALDANKSSIDIPNKLMKLAADPLSVPFYSNLQSTNCNRHST